MGIVLSGQFMPTSEKLQSDHKLRTLGVEEELDFVWHKTFTICSLTQKQFLIFRIKRAFNTDSLAASLNAAERLR